MTERLHPDGLAVDATPFHQYHCNHLNNLPYKKAEELERRARKAEAELAEARRTIAWLRAGPWARMPDEEDWWPSSEDFHSHLASKPPEGWEP